MLHVFPVIFNLELLASLVVCDTGRASPGPLPEASPHSPHPCLYPACICVGTLFTRCTPELREVQPLEEGLWKVVFAQVLEVACVVWPGNSGVLDTLSGSRRGDVGSGCACTFGSADALIGLGGGGADGQGPERWSVTRPFLLGSKGGGYFLTATEKSGSLST